VGRLFCALDSMADAMARYQVAASVDGGSPAPMISSLHVLRAQINLPWAKIERQVPGAASESRAALWVVVSLAIGNGDAMFAKY
jgi:hypothetical protein